MMPYRLGLPLWAHAAWKNRWFAAEPSSLASYASVFNAVEGNTAFYAIPAGNAISAWQRALDGRDCRISFKLPRSVTHEREPSLEDLDRFLAAIRPLKPHLGPMLLQFADHTGPAELAALEPVFEKVAEFGPALIEVRHPLFFSEPARLEPVLERHGFGRIMLDTRALYRGDIAHPDIVSARHRKPDVPLLDEIYNSMAFVRLVLHPDGVSNARWMDDWAQRAASMIIAGVDLTLMIHCPNNDHCPAFAADFHERLRAAYARASAGNPQAMQIPELPPWPVPRQDELF